MWVKKTHPDEEGKYDAGGKMGGEGVKNGWDFGALKGSKAPKHYPSSILCT